MGDYHFHLPRLNLYYPAYGITCLWESTEDMMKGLEEERKARRIATIPEVVRIIVSDYFKSKA